VDIAIGLCQRGPEVYGLGSKGAEYPVAHIYLHLVLCGAHIAWLSSADPYGYIGRICFCLYPQEVVFLLLQGEVIGYIIRRVIDDDTVGHQRYGFINIPVSIYGERRTVGRWCIPTGLHFISGSPAYSQVLYGAPGIHRVGHELSQLTYISAVRYRCPG